MLREGHVVGAHAMLPDYRDNTTGLAQSCVHSAVADGAIRQMEF